MSKHNNKLGSQNTCAGGRGKKHEHTVSEIRTAEIANSHRKRKKERRCEEAVCNDGGSGLYWENILPPPSSLSLEKGGGQMWKKIGTMIGTMIWTRIGAMIGAMLCTMIGAMIKAIMGGGQMWNCCLWSLSRHLHWERERWAWANPLTRKQEPMQISVNMFYLCCRNKLNIPRSIFLNIAMSTRKYS